MSLKIFSLPSFARDVKRLHKKYKKLPEDLKRLQDTLTNDPRAGIALTASLHKLRLSNSSTATGKSGGFRVIYYYIDRRGHLYLLKLYSKTEVAGISEDTLKAILQENGLA
ncbi:mRNA-degrading endonuclease RelE, toxin component of the RelBE toxin-antitoxin system [Desulfonatronum zhilinae]|nr:mRNA-degrading endonuclease RelE, toxin component of the RelBE toxin-antitoxin system [Desulfonatronum zhilinae]